MRRTFVVNPTAERPLPPTVSSSESDTTKTAGFLKIEASLDNAIAIAEKSYQSLGPLHRTSVLDVRQELATLIAALDRTTGSMHVFPEHKSEEAEFVELSHQGVSVCAAIARTTSALKSLTVPVSHDDGIALLTAFDEVEIKAAPFFAGINSRAISFEHGVPGITDHGLNRFGNLFQGLGPALSSVLPASISAEEADKIHVKIQGSVHGSFAHLTNLQLPSSKK